jgi:hypothetical protein
MGVERVRVVVIGETWDDQWPAEEADHLHRRGGDSDADGPTAQVVVGEAAQDHRDRSQQGSAQGEHGEECHDRALISAELLEDFVGILLEDVGVVEYGAEADERGI